jgi:hypothetical protein
MANMAAFKALGVTSAGCVNAAGLSARAAGTRTQHAASAVRAAQRAANGFNPFIERSFT